MNRCCDGLMLLIVCYVYCVGLMWCSLLWCLYSSVFVICMLVVYGFIGCMSVMCVCFLVMLCSSVLC